MIVQCRKPEGKATMDDSPTYLPNAFQRVLNKHGIKQWDAAEIMEFYCKQPDSYEKFIVELEHRYTIVDGKDFKIIKNREGCFISPATSFYEGDPIYHHSSIFYTAGMPFVFSDAGVVCSPMDKYLMGDTMYNATKVEFLAGVGYTPKDHYILLSNPKSDILQYVLYTSTYHNHGKNSGWYAKRFDSWTHTLGMILANRVATYKYDKKNHRLKNLIDVLVFEDYDFRNLDPNTDVFDTTDPKERYRSP